MFPGIGAEFMHHVHADDVAQAFEAALVHRDAAADEHSNVVAPSALNVRGYAQIAASWFGQTAESRSVTWDEFRHSTTEEAFEIWYPIGRRSRGIFPRPHPNCCSCFRLAARQRAVVCAAQWDQRALDRRCDCDADKGGAESSEEIDSDVRAGEEA
jgi:hypothetical protein